MVNNNNFVFILSIFLAFIIFLIDISLPLGIAGGVPYVIVIILGVFIPEKKKSNAITILTVCLTLIGFFLSPKGDNSWVPIVNRAFAILAILSAYFLLQMFHLTKKTTEPSTKDDVEDAISSINVIGVWKIFFSATALSVLFGGTIILNKEAENSLSLVNKSQSIRTNLSKLFSSLQDMETGQRGFILTGNKEYLEPFSSAANKVNIYLQRTTALVAGDSAQFQLITKLEPLITLKSKELNTTITLRQEKGFEAALAVVLNDTGKAYMDQVRGIISELEQIEEVNLSERQASFLVARNWALATDFIALIVIIGAFLTLVTRLNRFIKHRKKTDQNLRKARRNAEEANNSKSKFLASMSHELRTPLNAILGYTQLLNEGFKKSKSVKEIDWTDTILLSGEHLLKLIDEVLDLASIESNEMPLEFSEIDPHSILEYCAQIGETLAKQQKLTFLDQTSDYRYPIINVDESRLQQILLNLISNATKYNSADGMVIFSVSTPHVDCIRFSVADTGKGIPKEMQGALFQPFSRLGMENSNISGTGIGLSISKEIASRMGGAVGFESELNLGSTFWVEFPIVSGTLSQNEDEENAPSAFTQETPLSLSKVLCIEDDKFSLNLLESIIEDIEGIELHTAHTGEQGLNLAMAIKPNLIITDINLPGISGLDVLKKIKSSATLEHIPVIALTGLASQGEKEKGLEDGFVKYLTKPININELIELVEQFALGKNTQA